MSEDQNNKELAVAAKGKESENGKGQAETTDTESQETKYPYPKAIGFIVGNEFCERFNFYGMRTILVIYLTRMLLYSQDTATVIYHVFTMMVYLCCVLGAFISDSWLGKFKTIVYLSIVYVIGSVVISLGAIEPLHIAPDVMTMIGLALIALGSGGIKPCVASFGGDQFNLPAQAAQMATFFSIFYFAINSGSLISTTVTPILRQDVHCFDNEHCFPLAFGVPAVLMVVSIVVFIIGRPLYVNKPPEGNTFALVSKAIGKGISGKFREGKSNPKEHFLDYAVPVYGRQLVEDAKVLLRVLVLYIPIPIFWALFDQQGSRWTFQAMMMNGNMGSFDIKPEQMQLANPLLILILIPCYEYAFYPLLAKIGISRPLQKLTIGGILAGVAFIFSAILEISIVPTYGTLPTEGISQVRVFNGVPGCAYSFTTDVPKHENFDLGALGYYEVLSIDVEKKKSYTFSATGSAGCRAISTTFDLKGHTATSFFISGTADIPTIQSFAESPEKSEQGFSKVRVLANIRSDVKIYFKPQSTKQIDVNGTQITDLQQAEYTLMFDQSEIWKHYAMPGDVIGVIVVETDTTGRYDFSYYRLAPENSVNIFWQIPQYFMLTLGEVMFSVTGLEFSYSQAPLSMKAVLQACWQLAIAIGNLIVVIIAEIETFENQAYDYFLFAGLMFIDMILFMFLAKRYKSNDPNKRTESIDATPEAKTEESGKKGIINPTFHED